MENIYELFADSYSRHAMRPYVFDKELWTYENAYKLIHSMISMLGEQNIQPEDRIIIYMDNSIEYIVSYFAVLYMGATAVPISAVATVEHAETIITDSEAQAVIVSPLLYKKILNSEVIQSKRILVVDRDSIAVYKRDIPKMKTSNIAMLIYTSGTTSTPKGVMLSHKNLIVNTDSILEYLKLNETDSILATLSFSYSYGNSVLLTHTKVGAYLYIYKAIYPQSVLQMLREGRFTGFSTVGSYLNVLLKQEKLTKEDFKKLSYITMAGEQTSKNNIINLQELNSNLNIYVMYGQTEASARLTYLDPDKLLEKLGSVGKPIKNVQLKIIDESGNEVERGKEGEIVVTGENIMQGYFNKPNETNEVLKDGWLLTGDIGYLDKDGFLYITGRKKDIIKYLGYRISPVEIENSINLSNGIIESAVTEIVIDERVEIAAALILSSSFIDIKALCSDLRKKLAIYKIPKYFLILEELPKTSNGKIQRKEIQKLFYQSKKEDIYIYDLGRFGKE